MTRLSSADTTFPSGARPGRYLTADTPGAGGLIKQRPEDFLVDEQPLYQPCGEGEHIYLLIEKRELSTMDLVGIVADHFGVRRNAIGYAGMKDKWAVTRQVLSVHVPGKDLADFPEITHEKAGVLWADMHTNKLRVGHLRGNRFSIKIRDVDVMQVRAALASLRLLERHGVPNRFGPQRFGMRGRNHLVGRAMLLDDARLALDELLLPGEASSDGALASAYSLYAEGRYEQALGAAPRSADSERRSLRALAEGKSAEAAVRTMGRVQRRFFISAFQSAVFNRVLDERMERGGFEALVAGDLAWRHDNGAVFAVSADEAGDDSLRDRIEKKEISPSGPMWGPRMKRADHEPWSARGGGARGDGCFARDDEFVRCAPRCSASVARSAGGSGRGGGCRRTWRVYSLRVRVAARGVRDGSDGGGHEDRAGNCVRLGRG